MNDIINKFLDYLSTNIETSYTTLTDLNNDIEKYNYIRHIINLYNKNRDYLINNLNNNPSNFKLYLKDVIPIDNFLEEVRNIYYLDSTDIDKDLVKPQLNNSINNINNYINKLIIYIEKTDIYELNRKVEYLNNYINKILDLIHSIQYSEEITDIDILRELVDSSSLEDQDKIKLIENLLLVNIKENLTEKTDITYKEDPLLEEDNIKRLISLIEDKTSINLDDYRINEDYTPDIYEYLAYQRDYINRYKTKYPNMTEEDLLNKFYLDNTKQSTKYNYYYLLDNNTSYYEEDINRLNNKSNINNMYKLLEDNRLNNINKSTNNNLDIYGVIISHYKDLYLSYIKLKDNNIILLGISNTNNSNIISNRITLREDNLLDIITKVLREDTKSLEEDSKSAEERLNNNSIELLDRGKSL